MKRSAHISTDGLYRYQLHRDSLLAGGALGGIRVYFVMLNPSTADDVEDDPTVRRCIGFARHWLYDHLTVVNLFAYRATDPLRLLDVDDPVGPLNDQVLRHAVAQRDAYRAEIVCAWGRHTKKRALANLVDRRVDKVLRILGADGLQVIATTADGLAPRHPLYLSANLMPTRWKRP